jgi:hypothetical protein
MPFLPTELLIAGHGRHRRLAGYGARLGGAWPVVLSPDDHRALVVEDGVPHVPRAFKGAG